MRSNSNEKLKVDPILPLLYVPNPYVKCSRLFCHVLHFDKHFIVSKRLSWSKRKTIQLLYDYDTRQNNLPHLPRGIGINSIRKMRSIFKSSLLSDLVAQSLARPPRKRKVRVAVA